MSTAQQDVTLASSTADSLARDFARQGWALRRGIIEAKRLDDTRALFARVADGCIDQLVREGALQAPPPSDLPFERRLAAVPGDLMHRFGRSWLDQLLAPPIYDIHTDPNLRSDLLAILGPEIVAHPRFNGRPKLPNQPLTVVPWHQDAGYYAGWNGEMIVTVWIPLVPVSADNGCMQVISGSHQRGVRRHEEEANEGRFLFIADDPDLDQEATTVAMEPGDALFMHPLVYHRSLPNVSDGIRWSIDLRYLDAGTSDTAPLIPENHQPWVIASQRRPETSRSEWLAQLAPV